MQAMVLCAHNVSHLVKSTMLSVVCHFFSLYVHFVDVSMFDHEQNTW